MYSANINLLVVGLCEYIIVHWIFGSRKWLNEISWMIKSDGVAVRMFMWYLRICSIAISPFLIMAILGFFAYDMAVSKHNLVVSI